MSPAVTLLLLATLSHAYLKFPNKVNWWCLESLCWGNGRFELSHFCCCLLDSGIGSSNIGLALIHRSHWDVFKLRNSSVLDATKWPRSGFESLWTASHQPPGNLDSLSGLLGGHGQSIYSRSRMYILLPIRKSNAFASSTSCVDNSWRSWDTCEGSGANSERPEATQAQLTWFFWALRSAALFSVNGVVLWAPPEIKKLKSQRKKAQRSNEKNHSYKLYIYIYI